MSGPLAAPVSGIGISLGERAVGGTGSYQLCVLMDDPEFSGFENSIIEIKTLASNYLQKTVGRTDCGTFTGSFYLVSSDLGVQSVLAAYQDKKPRDWLLTLPDGATAPSLLAVPPVIGTGTSYQFFGPLAKLTPGTFTGEDAVTLEFEIAISGPVTITAAT